MWEALHDAAARVLENLPGEKARHRSAGQSGRDRNVQTERPEPFCPCDEKERRKLVPSVHAEAETLSAEAGALVCAKASVS